MSDIDYTRPLLLGYARRDLYLSDQHVEELKRQLGSFAQLEGFTLGTVYVEDPDTAPAAFDALIASVNRYEITAVVVPGLRHLALIDHPDAVKLQFERATGGRLIVHEVTP